MKPTTAPAPEPTIPDDGTRYVISLTLNNGTAELGKELATPDVRDKFITMMMRRNFDPTSFMSFDTEHGHTLIFPLSSVSDFRIWPVV